MLQNRQESFPVIQMGENVLFFLLFICAYNVWVISLPFPHLPYLWEKIFNWKFNN
jgi:hypothetical protein